MPTPANDLSDLSPPPDAGFEISHSEHGLCIRIPAGGIPAARTLVLGAIALALMSAGLLFALVWFAFFDDDLDDRGAILGVFGAAFLVIAAGTGLVVCSAIGAATLRGIINLVDRTLIISLQHRFRTKQFEFAPGEVKSIGARSRYQTRYNTSPSTGQQTRPGPPCLSILLETGTRREFFGQLSKAEARYLADLLHQRVATNAQADQA